MKEKEKEEYEEPAGVKCNNCGWCGMEEELDNECECPGCGSYDCLEEYV